MTQDEYLQYKSMSAKDRFFYLNEGSISDKLKKLIAISDFEDKEMELFNAKN